MTFSIIARFAVIAFAAAVAAWVPLVFGHFFRDGEPLAIQTYFASLSVALLGSFTVGLPVALLTFHLAWRHLVQSPVTLAMIACLSGVMMMLTSFVLLGREGLITLGLPSFIAAGTFGLLGWLWIIKPIGQMEEGADHV
ncbi:MAG: hypothetical protein WBA51_01370 [Erythrobacter sp.]